MLWFLFYAVHLSWFYWAVLQFPLSQAVTLNVLPGNFYFLSVNYMPLSTLIWLLIHLLSLAIAFQRPFIGPFSLLKREYWYLTVTSCPQRVTDPVTARWCRGCELYLTGTFHFFPLFIFFFQRVWPSLLFGIGTFDADFRTEKDRSDFYFFLLSSIFCDSFEIPRERPDGAG